VWGESGIPLAKIAREFRSQRGVSLRTKAAESSTALLISFSSVLGDLGESLFFGSHYEVDQIRSSADVELVLVRLVHSKGAGLEIGKDGIGSSAG